MGVDAGTRDSGFPGLDSGFPGFDSGPDCVPPMELCPSGCADLTSDSRNCGSCGFTCSTDWICSGGECFEPGPGGEGDLRIAGGGSSGRLEVNHAGIWGTICDDGFDDVDATVACRQLGYTSGTQTCCASFGPGVDPIHMDDLNCTGTETRLASCPFNGWDMHNCSHSEDVGVTCTF